MRWIDCRCSAAFTARCSSALRKVSRAMRSSFPIRGITGDPPWCASRVSRAARGHQGRGRWRRRQRRDQRSAPNGDQLLRMRRRDACALDDPWRMRCGGGLPFAISSPAPRRPANRYRIYLPKLLWTIFVTTGKNSTYLTYALHTAAAVELQGIACIPVYKCPAMPGAIGHTIDSISGTCRRS